MFKNGFAVVQRLIDVRKAGTTVVVPVPQGAMGTLWFTPSEGMAIDSVVVENDEARTTSLPAPSLDVLLALNVGRSVTLLVNDGAPASAPTRLLCRLLGANGTVVTVATPQGTVRAFKGAAVVGIEGKGLKTDSPFSASTGRVMRLRTSGRAGSVGVVALERGLSWVPAYAVNLLPGGKELSLVAKATVVNDLERLTDLDCRFVTGFPNLPFAGTIDPLVAFAGTMPGGMAGQGGGGFGGQLANRDAARAPAGIDFVSYDPTDNSLLMKGQAPDGEFRGELFFYRRPGVTVDVGGRAAYTLFRLEAPYETVYAWDLDDPAPGQPTFQPRAAPPGAPSTEEVWQTLRFENTAKLPLTTGPATTFSGGQIVGQDTLRYVSAGQTAELRVTRSLDLSPDSLEEETGRERGFLRYANNNPLYDRVTVRGTLTLVNRKAVAVKVRVRKPFTGEWISGDGDPAVTRTAAGLRQPNPTGLAEWTKTVAPGETLRLTYTVRLLVNS